MKKLIGILWILFLSSNIFGTNISGEILDQNSEPVVFAHVILNSTVDSSMVKLEYTLDDGSFEISNVEKGTYWITVKYVGYTDYQSDILTINEEPLNIGQVSLSLMSNELSEVVVTAKRPLLEMKADRLVFNVDGSINAAGSDLLELLRKSPGVMVDHNDNILMMGKSGVQILFDGKPSKLSGDNLANYLKSIPASEIDNIEIITNPSSKWDAEGNGGIINIKFKKDANLGANGSVNLSMSQGHKHRFNLSGTGNYRNKKWNAFGTLGSYDGEGWNPLSIRSELFGTVYDKTSLGGGGWNGSNLKFGVDHFISKKSTIGVMFNGYNESSNWGNDSDTDIYSLASTSLMDSTLIANANSDSKSIDWNTNVNYKFNDGDKRSFNIDLDYGFYDNDASETQDNQYLNFINSNNQRRTSYYTESPTTIEIKTIKLDYEQILGKGRLEVGAKVSAVGTKNTFDFYENIDGERILDISNSNQFSYDEMVSAAYVNYSMKLEKWSIQLGLRGEQTNSDGFLEAMVPSDNERVERSYFDIFPTSGITFQANEKNSLQLRYGKRIGRPNYQDLNPFTSRIDELTYQQGNPFLRPEYSHNISLTHSWNYRLNTTLKYSKTIDLIGQLTDAFGVNTTVIDRENIASQNSYSISIDSPIPVTEWWNSYTSVSFSYLKNVGNLGEGKDIDLSQFSGGIYSQHTFSLPKGYGLEVSGWGTTPSLWEGNFRMKGMYSIDFGVQKSFLDDRLSIKLGVSDIFRTSNWNGESVLGDLTVNATGGWDSRRAKINIGYRFGNDKVKSRNRSTGLEDEKNRIKSDNN